MVEVKGKLEVSFESSFSVKVKVEIKAENCGQPFGLIYLSGWTLALNLSLNLYHIELTLKSSLLRNN